MPMGREVVIISDYPSLDLAEKVYDILFKKDPPIEGLGKFNREALYIDRFANGEIDVNTKQNVRNREVFVIKSPYSPNKRMNDNMDLKNFSYKPNTWMMEVQLINDALVRASAANITNILPHMPYQRQDRRSIRYSETEKKWQKTRSPISARVMADNIQARAKHIITMDPHFKQIEGFFLIPIDCLSSTVLFADYIENEHKNLEEICIIAPDVGGAENADILAEMINAPMGFIRKKRGNPGEICKTSDVIIDVDITGKHAYILDDILDGGSTLVNAVNTLKKKNPSKVTACISHSILTGNARERLKDAGVELLTLNTIPILNKKPEEDIKIIDAAPLIAHSIYCSCTDRELSSLFYDYKQYRQKKANGLI